MCRLICVATKGIVPHQAMLGFKRLARAGKSVPGTTKGHRSGWGVGYFPGGKLRLVRELGDATNSVHFDETTYMAASNPDTRVLLGHLSSTPLKELMDRQDKLAPFLGRDPSGREWLFVFDGKIGDNRKTGQPYMTDPAREICPERLMREIMAEIARSGGDAKGGAMRDAVSAALGTVLGRTAEEYDYGHLNLAITDGATVFLTRYVDKEADWNEVHIGRLPRSVIGCSEPLDSLETRWEALDARQLVIFDGSLDITRQKL